MKIRRVLISVSDKTGVVELARAFADTGAEIVATGNTARVLIDGGLKVVPIEQISGSPEAYQGRMKTLSFPVCSGILYRRGDARDEADLKRLSHVPIDAVVVNFYPFEKTQAIEEIDIGGPTLVRAAAKNAPDVCVLTHSSQYAEAIAELKAGGEISAEQAQRWASAAWDLVAHYDDLIAMRYGRSRGGVTSLKLRYGENPHQVGTLEVAADSPIAWPVTPDAQLTAHELSYNNILDVSAGFGLMVDLVTWRSEAQSVVILKHNNPCGAATVDVPVVGDPQSMAEAQRAALEAAWQGDPISAFGGVILFSHSLQARAAEFLSERFVELIAAPGLTADSAPLQTVLAKRRKLKAVAIREFRPERNVMRVSVAGGTLVQTVDQGYDETLRSVTAREFPKAKLELARFGVLLCRTLKSNALAIVRAMTPQGPVAGGFQLVGAGQGQPNRVEALSALAIPRAKSTLAAVGGELEECVLVSDAFFPFRDTVDQAAQEGIRFIVQPGGSLKDDESIRAANDVKMAMALTGVRHFRH